MLLLLSLPGHLAAARPGCALRRSAIERWFSGWYSLAACTHSNTCLFLGVNNDAVVK
jgi:hypothetical protein